MMNQKAKVTSAAHGEMLSVGQAAEALGVSQHTVRCWLRQRKLGKVRAGRRVLIPQSEIELFISRNFVPSREDPAR